MSFSFEGCEHAAVKQRIFVARQLTNFSDPCDYFSPLNRNHEIGLRLSWLVLIKGPLCLVDDMHSEAFDPVYEDESNSNTNLYSSI